MVRTIREDELEKLLTLYKHLHKDDYDASVEDYTRTWRLIQRSDLLHYFVVEKDEQLISSLILSIIPNLTRGARAIGLIENVVTHSAYRKQGIGRKIMEHAIAFAKKSNCYKVMLLSDNKRQDAHRFYESVGFRADKKLGFVMSF